MDELADGDRGAYARYFILAKSHPALTLSLSGLVDCGGKYRSPRFPLLFLSYYTSRA